MNSLEQQLVEIDFLKPDKNKLEFTYKYHLSRGRFLSAMCIGGGNECVFLCYKDDEDSEEIDDLICLHNYDYDGRLTIEKMLYLIEYFERKW